MKKKDNIINFPTHRIRPNNRNELFYRVTAKYTAPDGTLVSHKDMDTLLERNNTNPTRWLKDYKKWKKNKERSDITMAKKKKAKAKKKVSTLDKIQKSLTKLEALHEKQSDLIFDINELIDDAHMDSEYLLEDE
jgi:hypothetical protein